jgi:hypothetical protein
VVLGNKSHEKLGTLTLCTRGPSAPPPWTVLTTLLVSNSRLRCLAQAASTLAIYPPCCFCAGRGGATGKAREEGLVVAQEETGRNLLNMRREGNKTIRLINLGPTKRFLNSVYQLM